MFHIAYLADHPDWIPTLAAWHYGQWAKLYPEETKANFAHHLRLSAQTGRIPLTVVALHDGKLAGSASLIEHDLASHPELSPWLANVYVDEPYRCRGIATVLIKRITREADGLGLTTIYLFTPGETEFYTRRGWQRLLHETCQNEPITIMSYQVGQGLD
jgi:N-acetylglutamate synthase-like GNAT family acetyltransferase